MSDQSKSRAQETLVKLFLRLNGYFTTGLIVHAPNGNGPELDSIGVRFPFHDQKEREVNGCEKLNIPKKGIDIILAEVKNNHVGFNKPLREGHSKAYENWSQLLRWIGIWKTDEIEELTSQTLQSVSEPIEGRVAGFNPIVSKSKFGKVTIRPINFSIEKEHEDQSIEDFINGEDMIEYIASCLDPMSERPECAVGYNYSMWGEEFEAIVKIFKAKDSNPTLESIYNLFKKSI